MLDDDAAKTLLQPNVFATNQRAQDDFIRNFCLLSVIQQQTPQANTTAAGTVAAGQQRVRAPTTPAGAAPSR